MAKTKVKKVVTPQAGQGIPAVVDPNPARTAADAAEAKVLSGATGDDAEVKAITEKPASEAAAEKAENEQDHADQVQQDAQDKIDEHNAAEEQADADFEAIESDMEVIQRIMADHKVDVVYENSKQEYFTVLNLAVNSEGGNKDRVKTHNA